jgi:ribosomal protein L37AE/L43A
MEATSKPRTEDKKYCTSCGKTGWQFRRDEDSPWVCSVCGAVEGKKPTEKKP